MASERRHDTLTGVAAAVQRPAVLAAAGIVLGLASIYAWIDPSNPPGFHRDEVSLAYNAWSISETLRDENGGFMPLYFPSFGDYKSPIFVYALAGLFSVTGPSAKVARGLAAAAVFAAILLLGLLAWRRTSDWRVALTVIVLGGLTPWLFELSRVAVEVTFEPFILVLVLLVLDASWRGSRWTVGRGVLAGLLLGLLAYSYAGGRLLAPLLALALLVFVRRERLSWLGAAWASFAAAFAPIALYSVRHPGALSARFHHTTFLTDGMSAPEIIRSFFGNYLRDLGLWSYVAGGDPKPHIHVHGASMLLATVALLALVGVVVGCRAAGDRWFVYAVMATLLVPVPAALTEDRFNGYRLALLPVLLLVLAIPALKGLSRALTQSHLAQVGAAALLVATVVQFSHFFAIHRDKGGWTRAELYEAGVPVLLQEAFSSGGSVYMDFDEPRAHAHARWYALTKGIPQDRVVVLADGGIPPDGSIVFGRSQACDFDCAEFARRNSYWLARARVPG